MFVGLWVCDCVAVWLCGGVRGLKIQEIVVWSGQWAGHCTWRAGAGRAQRGLGYAPSEARSLHVAGYDEQSEVWVWKPSEARCGLRNASSYYNETTYWLDSNTLDRFYSNLSLYCLSYFILFFIFLGRGCSSKQIWYTLAFLTEVCAFYRWTKITFMLIFHDCALSV